MKAEAWATRAAGWSELGSFLRGDRAAEVQPYLEKVTTTLLDKLADPHYKVVTAAMHCAAALVEAYPHAVEATLERLLPQLLLRAHDTRDATRAAARAAVGAVGGGYPSESLAPVVMRVLDSSNPKVKAAALELLSQVAPSAVGYLSTPAHVRSCVAKVLPGAADKNADVKRAAVAALHAIHSAGGPVFVQQVALLPPQSQAALKRAMADGAPNLADQIAAIGAAARATPRRPAPPPSASPHADDGGVTIPAAGGGAMTDRPGAMADRAPPARPASGDPALREAASRVNQPPRTAEAGGLGGGGSGGGGEDWMGLMPMLLRQLSGGATAAAQKEALLKMQKMSLVAPSDAPVWSSHFEHVLEAVLRCLQNADEKLRELGMACTKDMLRAQPQRFRAFTEHVLLRMLAAANDDARAVALGAEEALELLLSISDTHRCMGVLVPVIAKEGPPTLQLAIRLQSKLIGRFSQLQLLSILPQVLPPLFEAFKNQNADVRKAVVFCLVDMYMVRHTRPHLEPQEAPIIARRPRQPSHLPSIRQVLGEQLTPHLAELSTSQLKLVTIYINRTTKARADRLEQR